MTYIKVIFHGFQRIGTVQCFETIPEYLKETKTSASTANPSPIIENRTIVIPNSPFKIRIPRCVVAFGVAPLSKL